MRNFRRARKTVDVSVGESVRIIRELQGYSQNELARRTGIPQATISAIENDRARLGVERAKVIARALQCHPPSWSFLDGRSAKTQPLELVANEIVPASLSSCGNPVETASQLPHPATSSTKPASCYTFRLSVATHLLEEGYDARIIQGLLGHGDISTTMGFTHVLNRRGRGIHSPAVDLGMSPDPLRP